MQQGEAVLGSGSVRWANPQQMHLTLKFFGSVPESQIPDIARHLQECAGCTAPFRFVLRGTGIFGSRYQPRVLWAGTSEDAPLRQLGEAVLAAATAAGFPRERLPFVPHLTLARIARSPSRKILQNFMNLHHDAYLQEVDTPALYLYESRLHTTGAEHLVLEKFLLMPPQMNQP